MGFPSPSPFPFAQSELRGSAPYSHEIYYQYMAGQAAISSGIIRKLETGLGIAARIWQAMQAAYDLSRARKEIDLSQVVPVTVKSDVALH